MDVKISNTMSNMISRDVILKYLVGRLGSMGLGILLMLWTSIGSLREWIGLNLE